MSATAITLAFEGVETSKACTLALMLMLELVFDEEEEDTSESEKMSFCAPSWKPYAVL
jgi:hypothetical protein